MGSLNTQAANDGLTRAQADALYRQKASFRFDQLTPSANWVIVHNLGSKPVPIVFDSAGTQVEGTPAYVDDNVMTISFSAAFSGTAYLA